MEWIIALAVGVVVFWSFYSVLGRLLRGYDELARRREETG